MKPSHPINYGRTALFNVLKKYTTMQIALVYSQCLYFQRIESIVTDSKDLEAILYYKEKILNSLQPSCN